MRSSPLRTMRWMWVKASCGKRATRKRSTRIPASSGSTTRVCTPVASVSLRRRPRRGLRRRARRRCGLRAACAAGTGACGGRARARLRRRARAAPCRAARRCPPPPVSAAFDLSRPVSWSARLTAAGCRSGPIQSEGAHDERGRRRGRRSTGPRSRAHRRPPAPASPRSHSSTASREKAEKVVKPPRMPVARNRRTGWSSPRRLEGQPAGEQAHGEGADDVHGRACPTETPAPKARARSRH